MSGTPGDKQQPAPARIAGAERKRTTSSPPDRPHPRRRVNDCQHGPEAPMPGERHSGNGRSMQEPVRAHGYRAHGYPAPKTDFECLSGKSIAVRLLPRRQPNECKMAGLLTPRIGSIADCESPCRRAFSIAIAINGCCERQSWLQRRGPFRNLTGFPILPRATSPRAPFASEGSKANCPSYVNLGCSRKLAHSHPTIRCEHG